MHKDRVEQIAEEAVRIIKDNPTWSIQEAFEEAKKIYGVAK